MSEVETVDGKVYVNGAALTGTKQDSNVKAAHLVTTDLSSDDLNF